MVLWGLISFEHYPHITPYMHYLPLRLSSTACIVASIGTIYPSCPKSMPSYIWLLLYTIPTIDIPSNITMTSISVSRNEYSTTSVALRLASSFTFHRWLRLLTRCRIFSPKMSLPHRWVPMEPPSWRPNNTSHRTHHRTCRSISYAPP